MLFNFRWIIALVLVLIFIIPELWCLHLQFDSHPEKLVFGGTNVSGVRFFFWDSQFGRFFNTGPYKKAGGDPTFFIHTTLWAFLPWSILLCVSIVDFCRNKARRLRQQDWVAICGAGLALLVLSASQFQLPHYVVIIFPFYAIITSAYLVGLFKEKELKVIRIIQTGILFVLLALITVIHVLFRPELSILTIVLLISILILLIMIGRYASGNYLVYFRTVAVIILVNVYFNLAYYPTLTKYQGDSQAAFWLNNNNPNGIPVVKAVNDFSYAIDFYSIAKVHDYWRGEENKLPKVPFYLYANTETIAALAKDGHKVEPVKSFDTYRITRMKLKFLNHKTRKEAVETAQIVLVR